MDEKDRLPSDVIKESQVEISEDKAQKKKLLNKWFIIAAVVVLLVALAAIGYALINEEPQPITREPAISEVKKEEEKEPAKPKIVTAKFAVFSNNFYRAFSAPMYHNLSKKAYIEAPNTHVVIVKELGISWGEFFKTLPFEVRDDCLIAGTGEQFCTSGANTLKFYLNGKQVNSVLNKEIKQDDELLISYGQETTAQIAEQLRRVVNP